MAGGALRDPKSNVASSERRMAVPSSKRRATAPLPTGSVPVGALLPQLVNLGEPDAGRPIQVPLVQIVVLAERGATISFRSKAMRRSYPIYRRKATQPARLRTRAKDSAGNRPPLLQMIRLDHRYPRLLIRRRFIRGADERRIAAGR